MRTAAALSIMLLASSGAAEAQVSWFVNWESPQIHPLELTPDGTRLLAVNTSDARLEVFTVAGGDLLRAGSVPVGLDPVTVRARTNDEAWVVNHVSDSISIVDLVGLNITATIATGDEPTDVVFAGAPQRAFVTVSQLNEVRVYDPSNLAAAPIVIEIEGEDPRALATDGTRVYAAIFESGNGTTIIDEGEVNSAVNPYPGDQSPPPNDGAGFSPPINPALPAPPDAGLILRKDAGGAWRDDNGADWSAAVDWDLHDHDIAVIDAATLGVTYVTGLMNLNMGLAVGAGGAVTVIGTEALNDVRFEPNLNGTFVRVQAATFTAPSATASSNVDLNPHLDYTTPTVAQGVRDQSIGDPRGIAFNGAGTRAYVTGMGSSNLTQLDGSMARLAQVDVGQGPTGVTVNDLDGVVYVLNRFEASVSVVSSGTLTETDRVSFHDSTPEAIRLGRPHLYDTRATSGLGHVSCGSCHIDGRMDQVGWDLGDPSGDMKTFNQVCNFGFGGCPEELGGWHPMKGPMTTQTLVSIMDTGPLHWRADREDFAAFNGAFESLLGDDEPLTATEMQQFEDFIATLAPPPNPYREIDHGFPPSITIPGIPVDRTGDPANGQSLYMTGQLDAVNCNDCHTVPSGTNGQLTSAGLILESQSMKIPQLRNMYEKTGFEETGVNNRGFGFIHDGSVRTLFEFLDFPGFNFANDQEQIDVEAFLFAFSGDTHAGIGAQATIGGGGPDQTALRDHLISIDSSDFRVVTIAKGLVGGETRGFVHTGGGNFQSDRSLETLTTTDLDAASGPDAAITYTLVPQGTQNRLGVDRDLDGVLDRDELDACSNPADPLVTPGAIDPACCAAICAADPLCCDHVWDDPCADLAGAACAPGCPGDTDGSGSVDIDDIVNVILDYGTDGSANGGDVDGSGVVDIDDVVLVVLSFGGCG